MKLVGDGFTDCSECIFEKSYPMSDRDLARFAAKYDVDAQGCWIWNASLTEAGYGRFGYGKPLKAHRVAYQHYVGPIPSGLELDHLCRKPACVNPSHLEAVTHRENMRRSESVFGINARKTHCPRGHEYTPENTRIHFGPKSTMRDCIACATGHKSQARRAA